MTDVADALGIERSEALRLAGLTPTRPVPASDEEEDRLDRAWRRYRDDPGARGTVLRGLVDTWDREDGQTEDDDAQDGREVG